MKFLLEAKAFSGTECLIKAGKQIELDAEPPGGGPIRHHGVMLPYCHGGELT